MNTREALPSRERFLVPLATALLRLSHSLPQTRSPISSTFTETAATRSTSRSSLRRVLVTQLGSALVTHITNGGRQRGTEMDVYSAVVRREAVGSEAAEIEVKRGMCTTKSTLR